MAHKDIICLKTWTKNLCSSNTTSLQGKMLTHEREQGRVERAGPELERLNLNFQAITCHLNFSPFLIHRALLCKLGHINNYLTVPFTGSSKNEDSA